MEGLYSLEKQATMPVNIQKGKQKNIIPASTRLLPMQEDGTRTAFFGSGSEKNSLSKVTFEISSTGCGSCELSFKVLPKNSELNYMQRVDIHLFGDEQPVVNSGYIITRPVEGSTETEYKFIVHGYYNRLEKLVLFETYENMDPGAIVRDIAMKAERTHGIIYNASKISDAGTLSRSLSLMGLR